MTHRDDAPVRGAETEEEAEPTWDQRILAALPSSVDRGQLRENLRRTPTERVEQMVALVEFIEANRGSARVRAAAPR